ncbi:topoisomerase IV subunit A [Agrobacterium phage OLIVR5]|uniref:DNA topoisomerase (ATP-hydrolyzing) n=1 Tax=Agrobacterium phage OLIVR5 TaxID=2723773 RepID=A0A858MSL0_9CAUD|nr:DNA topoisomerase II [Agrobacterium phage OLIVR5]QIW87732.1 topoisomerase IV subunit A [Agrobacterium phage OLIVR5]QIW87994.1 topoisomerase IV subunit A [Agrobacterium phage OLIVR6]
MNTAEFLAKAAKTYSLMVATERAIPKVTDGLKDGQRIALWIMRNRSKTKVAAISGAMVESNLFLHGSADGLISGLAGPFVNNVPILDGDGNFGSLLDKNAFGAGRYIYAERSKFMDNVILADKELWEMVPSVDGDAEMCKEFLPLFPTVLLNGVSGVAVGWSTEILPHDPKELIKATKAVLTGKKTKKLMPKYLPFEKIKIEEIDNGRTDADSYILSGTVEIKNTSTVEITSLPPNVSVEKVQEHLDKLEEAKKITSYENHTAGDIRIVVKMSRNDLAGMTEEDLVKLFKISERITQRLVVVDFCGTKIRVFNNTEELIEAWVEWRFPLLKKRYEKMIEKVEKEISFLEAIIVLSDSGFSKKLSGFKSRNDVIDYINSKVKVSTEDCSRLAGLPSYRWTVEEIGKTRNEHESKIEELNSYIQISESETELKNVWIKDLDAIKF